MGRIVRASILVALAACTSAAQPPQPTGVQAMSVHYIDVGQGDSILLEFPKGAVLIDAGGEVTKARDSGAHLISYLQDFFKRRFELKNTIDAIIVTHPHSDHTGQLPNIVNKFSVKYLIDGGTTGDSGSSYVTAAKNTLFRRGGRYLTVSDIKARSGLSIPVFNSLRALDANVGLRLLSGSRGCENGNNDSLVLLVGYKKMRFLFAGDAQAQTDSKCRDQISTLLERYQKTGLLDADVLKVSHHGSASGTTDEWMRAVTPQVSIISAGQSGEAHRAPGSFHAWQFGQPRASAVRILEDWTSGLRPQKPVVTMKAARQEDAQATLMSKAVYCTCWDGDVVVTTDGYTLEVKTSRND